MAKKKTLYPVDKVWDGMDWLQMNCSQEGYDSIFNGPRPNGSSPSWYLKETGKLERPKTLGEWNFQTETKEWFDDSALLNQHQPHILDRFHCMFKYKEELVGEKHLYIITVYNPDYFRSNKEIGFSVIDPQYKNDIRNGNAYIVIMYAWEGYSGMEGNNDFEITEEWRKKELFPKGSVHFITGNLVAPNLPFVKQSGLVIHPFNTFENWNSDTSDEPMIGFTPNDDKFLFLTYNRNPRYERVYLGAKLIEHELIDKGLISLGKPEWFDANNIMRQDGVTDPEWSELGRRIPITLSKNLNFNLACNIEFVDWEQTFCSIITETLTQNNTLFLSEKTWKAIQIGHPFFVLGNQGTLDYLRNHSFQTFGEWWDESYDQVTDFRIRTQMVLKELKKLSKYSKEDLKIIRNEMKDVLSFNKELHYKHLVSNWGMHKSLKPVAMLELLWKIYKRLTDGESLL